jgi:DNA-binding cell septation regulator SpoVG
MLSVKTTAEVATNAFVVREWRPYSKNTLIGFVSLELPSGLIIHGITVHQKGDSMWVALPAREFQKDGERSWSPIIEFADRESRVSFQEYALAAINAYLTEELDDVR